MTRENAYNIKGKQHGWIPVHILWFQLCKESDITDDLDTNSGNGKLWFLLFYPFYDLYIISMYYAKYIYTVWKKGLYCFAIKYTESILIRQIPLGTKTRSTGSY